MGMEVSITERWSDIMPGSDVAHHIGCLLVREIHPEVGVSSPTALAPISTVILGGSDVSETIGQSGPMPSVVIITGHIMFPITSDISMLSPGITMSAPSVGVGMIFVVESSISTRESSPMTTEGIITMHIGLSVTVHISILGV